MNEDNAAKKYFSVRMGVSHLRTSQKMLLMFMMRMMEIRNMCMVIGFCKPYLLQINCANGINIVCRILIEKFPILKAVGGFTIQNTIKTLLTLGGGGGFSVLII